MNTLKIIQTSDNIEYLNIVDTSQGTTSCHCQNPLVKITIILVPPSVKLLWVKLPISNQVAYREATCHSVNEALPPIFSIPSLKLRGQALIRSKRKRSAKDPGNIGAQSRLVNVTFFQALLTRTCARAVGLGTTLPITPCTLQEVVFKMAPAAAEKKKEAKKEAIKDEPKGKDAVKKEEEPELVSLNLSFCF